MRSSQHGHWENNTSVAHGEMTFQQWMEKRVPHGEEVMILHWIIMLLHMRNGKLVFIIQTNGGGEIIAFLAQVHNSRILPPLNTGHQQQGIHTENLSER